MKLYWCPRTRSFSALWLMEETGQPYERVLIDLNKNDQKSPDYLKINPMGKVPALQDGDVSVAESAAICAYVAERSWRRRLATPGGRNICSGCSSAPAASSLRWCRSPPKSR